MSLYYKNRILFKLSKILYLGKEFKWISVCILISGCLSTWFGIKSLIQIESIFWEWSLYRRGRVVVRFLIYFDWVSLIFFGFISFISGAVFYFRGRYMARDFNVHSFIYIVVIFVIRMFFIVFRLNLVRIILGWDGLGIVSYALVIFYKNEKSRRAGMITAIRNRIGDRAIMLAIALRLEYGRWAYIQWEFRARWVVRRLIVLAAITKSAQIPFSAWLPAAIAAPTPVRALVHSSTLVTAGVYLLVRFRGLLNEWVLVNILRRLGVMTTLIARVRALYENDLKKVVALSTLRQLGIIVVTLSVGLSILAFIHLLIHAVFKALLFICSGKIIHNIIGNQDLRAIGRLVWNLPVTRSVINLSRFALCGVPFLSGFYSKDLIVEIILIQDGFVFKYLLYFFIVGFSASYSFRVAYLTFLLNTKRLRAGLREEKDIIIFNSKIGLMIISTVAGAVLVWLVISSPFIVSLPLYLKIFAFIRIRFGYLLGGLMVCLRFYKIWVKSRLQITIFRLDLWFLPSISGVKIAKIIKLFGLNLIILEKGWLEVFGRQGINYFLVEERGRVWNVQKNKINRFLIILLVVFVLSWCL